MSRTLISFLIISISLLLAGVWNFYNVNQDDIRPKVTSLAKANPAPYRPLDSQQLLKFVDQADTIVVATLTSAGQKVEEATKSTVFTADLEITATYKGNTGKLKVLPISAILPRAVPAFTAPKVGETRLYFLKSNGGEKNTFYDVFNSSLPVTEERPSNNEVTIPKNVVKDELLNNIRKGAPDVVIGSLLLLWCEPEGLALSKTMKGKDSIELRSAAVAYRMRCKDKDVFAELIEVLRQAHNLQTQDVMQYDKVGGLISAQISSYATILTGQQMEELLSLNNALVTLSISNFASQNADKDYKKLSPVAVAILMSSQDKQNQYDAITVLSYLRNVPGPGIDDFAEDSDKYVKEYIEWWNSRKDKAG